MTKQEMRDYIQEGTLLEHLEEVGKIKVEYLVDDMGEDLCYEDLELLVNVLDEDFNLPCMYEHIIGGYYLINEHFEGNRR